MKYLQVGMTMKTYLAKTNEVERKWFLVDAEDQILGRLAVKIANILRGRNKPIYTPHVDTGDFVIVVNAEKVRLTGNKETKKTYQDYSGHMGGLKVTTADVIREKKPERLVRAAVKGMLPRNTLARHQLSKLKIYSGSEHPHAAQNPELLSA